MAHNVVAQEEIDSRNERSIVVAGEFQTNSYLGIIAGSDTIFDYDLEKYQDDINKETKESIELLQADNISKGNCTLPFDEFTNNAIILKSTTGGTPATHTDNLQLAQVFTGKIVYTTVSKSFYLKYNNEYYSFWNVTRNGTYTLSSSDWYKDYQGKLFYNRSTKVLYAYDYDTRKISPITDIKVVQTTPNSETTPTDTLKGSLVYVEGTGKTYMWNGSYWAQQGGGNDSIQGQNISLLNNDSGYVTSDDVPNHIDFRNNKLYLEHLAENGESTVISEIVLPLRQDGVDYNLASYNKELGQTVPSDIALSNDNKLILRDRTTADGGKNVVTLRENLVTGKLHKATLVVADDAMLPNPVGAASEASKNNNIRITLDGVTYEVILANTTSVAVDSNDTTNTINNLYTKGKYIAKRLSDNFLSNIYNMTTRKIRVPYTSEYIVDNGVQKVVFTKCELTDEDVAESSIVIKKYGSSSFVTDNEMFTLTDEIINDVEVNVLTQEMITPEGKDMTNTIFKVQIDYDLQGQEIVIPQGCVIEIDGGSISNGYLRGNETMCNDFSAINAELIGTWRNNDNERIDNGVRRARKKDVKLSTYFYVGQHGVVENRKVDIYRYTKKVGMGDVNMVIAFEPKGILSQEDKALWFMPYQTIRYPQSDTTQIPTTITVNSPVYLGLEEINDSGETVPVELVPDTAREEDGKYIVEWGNADLIGLGLFLRQGIDTLSFVKFVNYCSDIYNVNNTEGELTIMKIKNTADFEARYVDRLRDLGFNFDTVYVMNEPSIGTYRADGEDTDTSKGSIYGSPERKAIVVNSVIEDLIEPMREKGYKVGVTLSQLFQYYNCIDEIFNALDEAGLNHYPTLSYDDDNLADTDDFSEYNIIGIRNVLQQNMKRKKMPLYITEGGCGYWKNALRAPMATRMKCAANYGGDNRLDRDHSIPGHIFFKSLFKAAAALDAKKVNIWFPNNLETSDVEKVILDCFYK